MTVLVSNAWYQHQAVLTALALNERLMESGDSLDPSWGAILFRGLLGLDAEGPDGSSLAVNSIGFSRSIRKRLADLARASDIGPWATGQFQERAADDGPRTAKLIATLLHDRAVPAQTLWRTAIDNLNSVELPGIDEVETALTSLSRGLRKIGTRREKLQAITHFMNKVPKLRSLWPALEPALVQPVIDWIPVSLTQTSSVQRTGIMVPVLVELEKNSSRSRVEVRGTLQDTTQLAWSAYRSLYGACALWRNRYANAPVYRLNEVDTAKVVIDLQMMEGIVQTCLHSGVELPDFSVQLDLTGQSLELPLGLAIYDRLTGTQRQGEFRASGAFTVFKRDEQDPKCGLTFLGSVAGTEAKALAAQQQQVDRFILASGSEQPSAKVPTVFANSLQAAVDYAFGGNGDGHRFVRCPDLAEAFKDEIYTTRKLAAFKNLLNSGPAVHETDEPLTLVLQALYDVNRLLGRSGKFRSNGRYTVVRLSETENADAAWASIWSAIDGDPADFDAFCRAPGFRKCAELFVKQLSRAQCTMADPRLSPHVLVLAGVNPNDTKGGLKGGAVGRFNIRRIMAEAEKILLRSPSPTDAILKRRIGYTRVILASDDGLDAIGGLRPSNLAADLQEAVIRLSAFRYGFTFDMARRQLGSSDDPMEAGACRALLNRLREVECDDGKPMLVIGSSNRHRRSAAPTAFEYMLRRRRYPPKREDLIEIHENAAHAIAPLLHPTRNEAYLGVGSALAAPWLDEAYHQLSQARLVAIQSSKTKAKVRIQSLRLRLLRSSGWFLLERLPAMMGQKGYEAIYWDFADRLTPSVHPALHARAASFATELASQQASDQDRSEFYRLALQHLDHGARTARDLDDWRERKGAMFLIASERCRLAHVGRDEPEEVLAAMHRDIARSARLALQHIGCMREIYWSGFFAEVGDLIEDPKEANRVYRAGLWNANLPKAVDPDDDALIGWAGTLRSLRDVPPFLSRKLREHFAKLFFERRAVVERRERQHNILPSERQRKGMARLYEIRDFLEGKPVPRNPALGVQPRHAEPSRRSASAHGDRKER